MKPVTDSFCKNLKCATRHGKNFYHFQARNPTFVFLSLSACTEGMIISGVATFGAKFLQEKFNLPAALGSFVMGKDSWNHFLLKTFIVLFNSSIHCTFQYEEVQLSSNSSQNIESYQPTCDQ